MKLSFTDDTWESPAVTLSYMPDTLQASQALTARTYNISVVGPPNAGKSCLCNRFALPHPDFYQKDHPTTLNADKFGGEIVNSEHWLYWGCVSRQVDDYTVNFKIIEQTEFRNESTSDPFISDHHPARAHDYLQRSSDVHLSSKGKLRYICKEQLGEENLYEKEYLPKGDVEINGFILVFDANSCDFKHIGSSRNPVQPRLQEFLTALIKLKKPVVLAVSKSDTHTTKCAELSTWLQKSNDLRKVPVIETSAHNNINVEEAFIAVVKLMNKPRLWKAKYPHYVEAVRLHDDKVHAASGAYTELLLRAHPEFLDNWESFMKRYSHQAAVVTYITMVGTEVARKDFERLTTHRHSLTKKNNVQKTIKILESLLPNLDTIRNKSLDEILEYIRQQETFHLYFCDTVPDGDSVQSTEESFCLRRPVREERIPFSFLTEVIESDSKRSLLHLHLDELIKSEKRHTALAELETMLYMRLSNSMHESKPGLQSNEDNSKRLLPGQPFPDVWPSLKASQTIDILSEEEMASVYKRFQSSFHVIVREYFLDLLLESSHLFVRTVFSYITQLVAMESADRSQVQTQSDTSVSARWMCHDPPDSDTISCKPNATNVNNLSQSHLWLAPPRGLKETHLSQLEDQLSQDWRHESMAYFPSERRTLVTSHFNMLLPFFPSALAYFNRSGLADRQSSSRKFSHHNLINSDHQSLVENLGYISSLSQLVSTDSPSQYCPAYTSEYCIDRLFRQLAYQHLPINPCCLEPPRIVHSTIPSSNEAVHPEPELCEPIAINSAVPTTPGTQRAYVTPHLSIAIGCVCTDTLAAQAVVNLLACAGFSFSPVYLSLPSGLGGGASRHRESGNRVDNVQPVLVSASWPLSTDRLPPVVGESYCATHRASNRTPIHQVRDGMVHASLLSLHQVLNDLILASFNSTHSSSQSSSSSTTAAASAYNSPVPSNNGSYDGYIFILGVPHASQPTDPIDHERCDNTQPQSDSLFVPNAQPESPKSPPTSAAGSEECEENAITPRPKSSPAFFGSDTATTSADEDTTAVPDDDTAHARTECTTCTCCALQYGNTALSSFCACGICCSSCTHSSSAVSNGLRRLPFHNRKTDSHRQETRASTDGGVGPSRIPKPNHANAPVESTCLPRSWDARLSAVHSALELIPKGTPHLLLLAQTDAFASINEPLLFPAPGHLNKPSSDGLSRGMDSSSDGNASDQKSFGEPPTPLRSNTSTFGPLNSDGMNSTDWIPAGTSILDHVIQFLNDCWSMSNTSATSEQSCPSNKLSDEKRQVTLAPEPRISRRASQVTPLGGSECSASVQVTCNAALGICCTTSSGSKSSTTEKSNTNLFQTASATGRKAFQTALKRISVNARKCHHNAISPAVPTTISERSTTKEGSGKLKVLRNSSRPVCQTDGISITASKASMDKSAVLTGKAVVPKELSDHSTVSSRCAPSLGSTDVRWVLDESEYQSIPSNTSNTISTVSPAATVPSSESIVSASSSPPGRPNWLQRSGLRDSISSTFNMKPVVDDDEAVQSRSLSRARCSVPDCAVFLLNRALETSPDGGGGGGGGGDGSSDLTHALNCSNRTMSSSTLVSHPPVRISRDVVHLPLCRTRSTSSASDASDEERGDCGGDDKRNNKSIHNGPAASSSPFDTTGTEALMQQHGRTEGVVSVQPCQDEPLNYLSTSLVSSLEPSIPMKSIQSQTTDQSYGLDSSAVRSHPDSLSLALRSLSLPNSSTDTSKSIAGPELEDNEDGAYNQEPSSPNRRTVDNDNEDGVESFYEELDLCIDRAWSPSDCQQKQQPANPLSHTSCRRSGKISPLCPLNLADSSEHIYCDPVDVLGPACLQRHRCATMVQPWFAANMSETPKKSEQQAKYTDNFTGNRRERHRSFSTPEGCTTFPSVDSITPSYLVSETHLNTKNKTTNPAIGVISSPLVRGVSNQLSTGRIDSQLRRDLSRTIASNCPDPVSSSSSCSSGSWSCVSSTPPPPTLSSFGMMPKNHRIVSPPQRYDPSPSSSSSGVTSVSSPTSGQTSESLGCEGLAKDDVVVQNHGGILTMPRLHHHHYWHHRGCVHYSNHPIQTPSTRIAREADEGIFSTTPSTRLSDPNGSTPTCRRPSHTSSTALGTGVRFMRRKSRPLSGGMLPDKRTHSTLNSTPNLFLSSTSPPSSSVETVSQSATGTTVAGVGFINATDFPVHYPSQPDRRYSPEDVTSFKSVSGLVERVARPPRVTTASVVAQKDSKWSVRGRKLNIFHAHRSAPPINSSHGDTSTVMSSRSMGHSVTSAIQTADRQTHNCPTKNVFPMMTQKDTASAVASSSLCLVPTNPHCSGFPPSRSAGTSPPIAFLETDLDAPR